MTDKPFIITLDGPSGCGKSTASALLASHFQLPYLDTGAMYRTVAWKALKSSIALNDEAALTKLAESLSFRFSFSGMNSVIEVAENGGAYQVLGPEIRTPEVSLASSKVAGLKNVRRALVRQQQEIGRRQGAVVEGRDAGTVIFPAADIKFFLTASSEARAERRYLELKEKLKDKTPTYESVLQDIKLRDKQDEERVESPSKPAPDAQIIDTSGRNLDQVVNLLIQKVVALKA